MDDGGLTLTHPAGEVRLEPGRALTFGRSRDDQSGPGLAGAGDEVHLGLSSSARLHAVAGTVEALDDGWVLVNQGRWLQLRVVRLDGPETSDLAPGRSLRVPWPSVRVEMVTGEEQVGFQVDCPVLDVAGPVAAPIVGETVRGLDLDRTAGYFRALVALCEPRLRDPSTTDVPTVAEVARTLSLLPVEPDRVSIKAVERRLAHARRKLAIGGDPDGVSAAGLEVRDASGRLVEILLRTGTVMPSDLALLEGAAAPSDRP